MRARFAALLTPLCWPTVLAYILPKKDLETRMAELETRMAVLITNVDLCCDKPITMTDWAAKSNDLEVMVKLRKKMADLEKRVEVLEK